MSLTNKSVVVITGAAAGIGRALAERVAAENVAGLALVDVNEAGLRETAQKLAATGTNISLHQIDVGNLEQMQRLPQDVLGAHQRVTHLINNAGVALFGDVAEVSLEDIEWLMKINFWGVVYATKFFLPILQQQPLSHIVNISSVFGLIAPPGNAAYSASKFAVRGFSEALRHELEGTNVLVSVVHPGGIKTNIANSGRLGQNAQNAERTANVKAFNEVLTPTSPETAADVIVRGIKARNPRILIGPDARSISFLARLFPRYYLRVMDFLSGGKLLKIRRTFGKAV